MVVKEEKALFGLYRGHRVTHTDEMNTDMCDRHCSDKAAACRHTALHRGHLSAAEPVDLTVAWRRADARFRGLELRV